MSYTKKDVLTIDGLIVEEVYINEEYIEQSDLIELDKGIELVFEKCIFREDIEMDNLKVYSIHFHECVFDTIRLKLPRLIDESFDTGDAGAFDISLNNCEIYALNIYSSVVSLLKINSNIIFNSLNIEKCELREVEFIGQHINYYNTELNIIDSKFSHIMFNYSMINKVNIKSCTITDKFKSPDKIADNEISLYESEVVELNIMNSYINNYCSYKGRWYETTNNSNLKRN